MELRIEAVALIINVGDVLRAIERFAPAKLGESWDNTGLLVGRINVPVTKAIVSLDLLDETIEEARALGANLIITHHPVIFIPISSINDVTKSSERLLKLIENNIAVICAHTNLDSCLGGTNDVVFDMLRLTKKEVLVSNDSESEAVGAGRTGFLTEKMVFSEFAKFVKGALCADFVSVAGELNCVVEKVAIVTGSGASSEFIMAANLKKCDVLVTGDLTHHMAQLALDLSVCVVDASHYFTEMPVCAHVAKYLEECFKDNDFQAFHSNINGRMIKIL